MTNPLLPELLAQCCDAGDYLSFGMQCATEKICYGDIRPGGAYYWFSWPVRLGLPSEALVYANLFMLGISSLLSAALLILLCNRANRNDFKPNFLYKAAAGISCLAMHLVFFWPTVFTTLSDPPAALFLLNGVWLLLLSSLATGIKQPLLLVVASVFIGLAGWIRAFYFYPVLIGVCVGLLGLLVNPRRKMWHFLLLIALLPPGLQVANTYVASGKIAFLNSGASNSWTNTHLTSSAVGYDTVFQNQGHYTNPQYCDIRVGLLDSLKQKDHSSLFCLLGNRVAFYLASYRSMNYIYPGIKNRMFTSTIENIGDDSSWLRENLDWHTDVATDPQGGMTADKMTVRSVRTHGGSYVAQWVALPGSTDYTFSVWLWSDTPVQIPLAITRHTDDLVLASTIAAVTPTPQRFSVSGRTLKFDEYSMIIGSLPSAGESHFGSSPSDAFYAWGAQLEEGPAMTGYAGVEPLVGSDIRSWNLWLGVANGIALASAMLFTIRHRAILLLEPTGLPAIATATAIFAEALVIIPEQRFCMAFMVIIWVFAAGLLFTTLARYQDHLSR